LDTSLLPIWLFFYSRFLVVDELYLWLKWYIHFYCGYLIKWASLMAGKWFYSVNIRIVWWMVY
jgi:hypothetical protein